MNYQDILAFMPSICVENVHQKLVSLTRHNSTCYNNCRLHISKIVYNNGTATGNYHS